MTRPMLELVFENGLILDPVEGPLPGLAMAGGRLGAPGPAARQIGRAHV